MFLDGRAASHSLERPVTTSHSTWEYYKMLPPPLRLYPSVPNQSRLFFREGSYVHSEMQMPDGHLRGDRGAIPPYCVGL